MIRGYTAINPDLHKKLIKQWDLEREQNRKVFIKPVFRNREVLDIANYYDKGYNHINFFQLADDNTLKNNAKLLHNGDKVLEKLNVLKKENRIKNMVQDADGRTRFISAHTDDQQKTHSTFMIARMQSQNERIQNRTQQTFKLVKKSIMRVKEDVVKNNSSLEMFLLNQHGVLERNFKDKVLDCIQLLKDMDLNPSELVEKNVFPKQPFFRGKDAKQFFINVKDCRIDKVEEQLNKDRFILYEHDHMGMTALHWAAKRNYYEIIQLLIDKHAQVNKQDCLGRTALYLAAQ